MPTEKGDKQAVTIWVDKSLVERIEKLVRKARWGYTPLAKGSSWRWRPAD